MPILTKTLKEVVNDELIDKGYITNRIVKIAICKMDGTPSVILGDGCVRDDAEWEAMKKQWDKTCKMVDAMNKGKTLSKHFKLCMQIDEIHDDGTHINPLGTNVSLIIHKIGNK